MNLGQLTIDNRNIKKEDDNDVRFIIKNFLSDGYSKERLNRALCHAELYEKEHRGSRGNRNVIRAIRLILSPSSDFKIKPSK